MSSLQVKKRKTKIWFRPNTLKDQRNILVGYFRFKVVSSFGKYFGIYIDGYHRKKENSKEIIVRIKKKLHGMEG